MSSVQLGASVSQENVELRRIIAVLTRQMGGIASITSSDMLAVEGKDLEIKTLVDPYMIRIRVSE